MRRWATPRASWAGPSPWEGRQAHPGGAGRPGQAVELLRVGTRRKRAERLERLAAVALDELGPGRSEGEPAALVGVAHAMVEGDPKAGAELRQCLMVSEGCQGLFSGLEA